MSAHDGGPPGVRTIPRRWRTLPTASAGGRRRQRVRDERTQIAGVVGLVVERDEAGRRRGARIPADQHRARPRVRRRGGAARRREPGDAVDQQQRGVRHLRRVRHGRRRVAEPGHRGVRGEERLGDEPRIQRVAIDEHDGAGHGGHITSQRLPMRPSSSSDRSPRAISSRTISSHSVGVEVPQAAELGQRQAHAGHLAVLAGDDAEQVVARGAARAGARWRGRQLPCRDPFDGRGAAVEPRVDDALCNASATIAGARHGRIVRRHGRDECGNTSRPSGAFSRRRGRRERDGSPAVGPDGHASCNVVRREVRTMSRFHTIVVALDFSDSTPDALEPRWRWRPPRPAAISTCCTSSPARCRRSGRMSRRRWICAPSSRRGPTPRSSSWRRSPAASALDPANVTTAVEVGAPANEIVRYAEAAPRRRRSCSARTGMAWCGGSCSAAWPTSWSARRRARCWSCRTGRCGMPRRRRRRRACRLSRRRDHALRRSPRGRARAGRPAHRLRQPRRRGRPRPRPRRRAGRGGGGAGARGAAGRAAGAQARRAGSAGAGHRRHRGGRRRARQRGRAARARPRPGRHRSGHRPGTARAGSAARRVSRRAARASRWTAGSRSSSTTGSPRAPRWRPPAAPSPRAAPRAWSSPCRSPRARRAIGSGPSRTRWSRSPRRRRSTPSAPGTVDFSQTDDREVVDLLAGAHAIESRRRALPWRSPCSRATCPPGGRRRSRSPCSCRGCPRLAAAADAGRAPPAPPTPIRHADCRRGARRGEPARLPRPRRQRRPQVDGVRAHRRRRQPDRDRRRDRQRGLLRQRHHVLRLRRRPQSGLRHRRHHGRRRRRPHGHGQPLRSPRPRALSVASPCSAAACSCSSTSASDDSKSHSSAFPCTLAGGSGRRSFLRHTTLGLTGGLLAAGTRPLWAQGAAQPEGPKGLKIAKCEAVLLTGVRGYGPWLFCRVETDRRPGRLG